jgi:hypothetical protein
LPVSRIVSHWMELPSPWGRNCPFFKAANKNLGVERR